MRKKYHFEQITILFLFLLNFDLIAQPYYFYSDTISSDSSNIYRVDLSSGEKKLFLARIRQPFDFVWDNYQKWIFVSNFNGIYIYNCENPGQAMDFIPPRDFEDGVTAFSVPSKDYLYLSWFEKFENESYTIQNTTLLDINSLQPIKECSSTIDSRSIISKDRNFIYQFSVDSIARTFIDKYSIELDSIIDIKYFNEIVTNGSLHFNNGREGEILFSLDEIMGDMNSQKYFVYDIDNNIYHPKISFPTRSYGYLTPNAEYIILQKALWEPEKTNAEDITGEISLYYTTTGKLVSNLTLPPEGKILLFDSYPNKFFYYVPETQQAITIDITTLLQSPVSTYSLLAAHSIKLDQSSSVLSGDIGVNQSGQPPLLEPGYELSLSKSVTTPAGYNVKANRILLNQNSVVNGDLYYNQLKNSKGIINGTQTTPLELPLFAELPEFKSSTPGTENITVPNNGTRVLAPGSYGNVVINKGGTLVLSGGTYHFNGFTGGQQSNVQYQSQCEVRIAGRLDIGKQSSVIASDTLTHSAKDIVIYVGGINGTDGTLGATPKAATVGASSKINANIYVPNGTVQINANSELEGSIMGKDIKIDQGVKIKLKSAYYRTKGIK